ncbi:hypothetical protein ACFP1I_11995 [Dyadobacter subterraneus]|uniref:RDD family protein n=1 Tax=Dyadobacter subterraneus TaxID=2773304 RepID=A0ABR9WDS6_9BACT|nr:hypothetical protein [Dyadobacter subterraneus]MBE9463647.1 hypothetical protein [Dyadobacter subterraneus]
MIDNIPEPNTSLAPEQEEKLRELTTQSWNLELVISGVAMFAVLQLPPVLDEAFGFVRYNMLGQTQGLAGIIPALALSMMKASCYVLFIAFLTNFVMRAFWVGLVGLLAVYPNGIDYKRIPFTNKHTQQRMRSDLGSLESYIIRLDRHCNIVFAVAFLFVFLLIIVALSYVLVLLIYSGFQPLIPNRYWRGVKVAALVFFGIFMLISIVAALPQVRSRPGMANFQYKMLSFSKWIYWGLHKPFSYIINTFYSHLTHSKLLKISGLMSVVFFALIFAELLTDLSRVDHRLSFMNGRHLFTARVDSLFVNPDAYDNQRADDQYVSQASIQADVIREPFIRLYIAYPKAMDTIMSRLAVEPNWGTNLPIKERRKLYAEWTHKQINRLIAVHINDSLYADADLLFTQLGYQQQRGYQTVLLPTNLKTGKNYVRIGIKPDSLKKEENIANIPFWYVPEQ